MQNQLIQNKSDSSVKEESLFSFIYLQCFKSLHLHQIRRMLKKSEKCAKITFA